MANKYEEVLILVEQAKQEGKTLTLYAACKQLKIKSSGIYEYVKNKNKPPKIPKAQQALDLIAEAEKKGEKLSMHQAANIFNISEAAICMYKKRKTMNKEKTEMSGEIVRQLNGLNGRQAIMLRMQLFSISGKLLTTCTIDAPQDLTEEESQWIASEIKILFNSLGKASY